MIILRFGRSGRLARICESAMRLANTHSAVYTARRDGTFILDSDLTTQLPADAIIESLKGRAVTVIDASVDHSSTANLLAHETFKKDVLLRLRDQGVLARALGFSSGITLADASRIRAHSPHMQAYREQKLAQEELFNSLHCPVLLPNLFTLVGPITYATQGAAWAQILKARVQRGETVALSEPHVKKAWASEFRVSRQVLAFLVASAPESVRGPLVDGDFTLADIASSPCLPIPALNYTTGGQPGWLEGDYLAPEHFSDSHSIHGELLRALCL